MQPCRSAVGKPGEEVVVRINSGANGVTPVLSIDQRQAAQMLLDIVDRLHALRPGAGALAADTLGQVALHRDRTGRDAARRRPPTADRAPARALVADALVAAVTREQVLALRSFLAELDRVRGVDPPVSLRARDPDRLAGSG